MNRRPSSLEARIETLKQAIIRLGDLRPGKLSQQYNVCGKADCRCKADPPQKHGPYYQLSFTRKGKSSTQFVREEDLAVVRLQLRNYQRLQELIDRWITLGMELSRLKLPSARLGGVSRKPPRVANPSQSVVRKALISEAEKTLTTSPSKGFRVSRQKLIRPGMSIRCW